MQDPKPARWITCPVDFQIWDQVLARRPGWPLETLSMRQDASDYTLMLEAQSNPLKASAVEVISAMGTIFHRELPFRGLPLNWNRRHD